MIKLKIWRMEEEERVEVFQGQIKEERFQFVRDGDTTYMVQLDMPKTDKARGRARQPAKAGKRETTSTPNPPKAPCPHCGKSFLVGRGLNRHLKSCPKNPKASRPEKKASGQAPTTSTQDTQPAEKPKERSP